MSTTELAIAVKAFADVGVRIPEPELEREDWEWRSYDGLRFAYLLTYQQLRELASATTTERLAQAQPPSTAHRILAQYTGAYRDLHGALAGVNDSEIDVPPAEDEWPLRAVIGHMMHVQAAFLAIITYAVERQRTGDGRPVEISQAEVDRRRGTQNYDGTLAELMGRYDELHRRVITELADIGEDELAAPSLWWEGWEVETRFRMHRFDAHLREHLIQVDKTLAGIGHPPTEPERLVRLIYNALGEAEGAGIGAPTVLGDRRRELAEEISARAQDISRYS